MTDMDRLKAMLEEVVTAAIERVIVSGDALVYFAPWLYTVDAVHAGSPVTYDLRSTDPRLPDLAGVALWPGPSGASAQATVGSQVTVQFANADRTKPRVVGLDPNAVAISELPATTSVLLGAAPRDFVALAAKVAELRDQYNSHKHTGVTAGTTTSGTTDTPSFTNFASSKVQASQ